MSAEDLVVYVSDVGFLSIFAIVAIRAVRYPTHVSLLAAAFFGGIAMVATVGLVTRVTQTQVPLILARIDIAVLMALPWVLLNIAHEFRPVPRFALWATAAGMLLTAGSAFMVQQIVRPWYLVSILGYFALVTTYATWRFVAQARISRGVTRRRMQAVAAGSGFLAFAIACAAVRSAIPAAESVLTLFMRAGALCSVAAYFAGFAPPRLLRRLWQDSALRAFLQAATTVPPAVPLADATAILNPAIADIVGAPQAMIVVWDEEQQRLIAPGFRPLDLDPLRTPTIAARVFEAQRAAFIPDALAADPDNADVYRRVNATALMIAPITQSNRRFGIVSAFADRPSVFALEDLSLLDVLANEVAGFLHRRELVAEGASIRAQEDAMQLKEQFLDAAAHDLRTPLTVILGQAELMRRRIRRHPEAPADLGGIERMLAEAQRMRQLTEDLLDISHSEAGGFLTERTWVDLVRLAQEVATSAEARSARHRITVSGAPVFAAVDEKRITQVITNLVENAVKFSPDGGEVAIGLTASGAEAHLTVSDEGIGIPDADLDAIFERFRRGSSGDMRRFAGTGVGLFLCKRIVEEHGGRIWAERRERGSRLHVMLPADPADKG